jgi:hypothetical protein
MNFWNVHEHLLSRDRINDLGGASGAILLGWRMEIAWTRVHAQVVVGIDSRPYHL